MWIGTDHALVFPGIKCICTILRINNVFPITNCKTLHGKTTNLKGEKKTQTKIHTLCLFECHTLTLKTHFKE